MTGNWFWRHSWDILDHLGSPNGTRAIPRHVPEVPPRRAPEAILGLLGAPPETCKIPRRVLEVPPRAGPQEHSGESVLGGLLGHLVPSWGHLGAFLGQYWDPLEATLGDPGGILGALRPILGPSWGISGSTRSHFVIP